MNPNVSFFAGMRAHGKPTPILTLLEQIRAGEWVKQIHKLRNAPDSDTAAKLKRSLPGFTASATTKGGRKGVDVTAHSGLLQGDVDKIGMEAAETLRETLKGEPCVFAAWISPSGDGLKLLIRVPADVESHAAAFLNAERHFLERWNVALDPSCKDISRLCFVSADPGLWVNAAAETLPAESSAEPTGRSYVLHEKAGTPSDYSPTSESKSESESISTQQAPHRFNSADLAKLFHSLVRCRVGTVHAGTRNAHLVELIPFLFSAVGEKVALTFAAEFHREHEDIFKNPIQRTLVESESLLRGVAVSYLAALPPETRTAYAALPDTQQAAFRVCRALATLECETHPPGQFFLSCANLAARLGIVSMAAHRILGGFVGAGILEPVTKGKRREKGAQGIATTFKFLLP